MSIIKVVTGADLTYPPISSKISLFLIDFVQPQRQFGYL